jgi:hypothetical protein
LINIFTHLVKCRPIDFHRIDCRGIFMCDHE